MRWLFALCLFCAFASVAQAQESRIAAVVNDEIVTGDDLAARLKLVMSASGIPDTPQNRQRLEPRVLRGLIDEKLQMQEAKRLTVTVSDKEIQDALARIEQRNNMPKGGLDAFLAHAGIPRSSLVDQITASIAWQKVVRNRLAQEVTISDEEVNEAMARLKADVGKPQNRIAEIFLSVDNPSQDAEVHSLADRLIAQIRGGANFSAVAQQFSQSPSAAVGGDIGWVTASQLGSPLGDAVDKMQPGQMSYPIRTTAGYYILYLVQRRTLGATDPNDTLLSLAEVVFPLSESATPEERQRVTAAAQRVSDTAKSCGEMAKIGREQAPQLSTEIPQVKAGELPADLRQKVLALKVAEASKPLPLRGGIGVIMICHRQNPTGGMPTREQVADSLGRERLDALARRYMRNLRRGAFVDIRE
jgi:peptidyl-prolyl cis-trans isomerase SurA